MHVHIVRFVIQMKQENMGYTYLPNGNVTDTRTRQRLKNKAQAAIAASNKKYQQDHNYTLKTH